MAVHGANQLRCLPNHPHSVHGTLLRRADENTTRNKIATTAPLLCCSFQTAQNALCTYPPHHLPCWQSCTSQSSCTAARGNAKIDNTCTPALIQKHPDTSPHFVTRPALVGAKHDGVRGELSCCLRHSNSWTLKLMK